MAKFKKVALKDGETMTDDPYEYDEPDLEREDLDLSKINIFLHNFENVVENTLFRIRLAYGQVGPDGGFVTLQDNEKMFKDVNSNPAVERYVCFDYQRKYNHLTLALIDSTKGVSSSYLQVSIRTR